MIIFLFIVVVDDGWIITYTRYQLYLLDMFLISQTIITVFSNVSKKSVSGKDKPD